MKVFADLHVIDNVDRPFLGPQTYLLVQAEMFANFPSSIYIDVITSTCAVVGLTAAAVC